MLYDVNGCFVWVLYLTHHLNNQIEIENDKSFFVIMCSGLLIVYFCLNIIILLE